MIVGTKQKNQNQPDAEKMELMMNVIYFIDLFLGWGEM